MHSTGADRRPLERRVPFVVQQLGRRLSLTPFHLRTEIGHTLNEKLIKILTFVF